MSDQPTPVNVLPAQPEQFVSFDRENAFLLYATFVGDCEKTAAALGIRPVDVLRAADEEGWAGKLGKIIELKKSSKPGDMERAINRALNYVQAYRMRAFLARVVQKVTGLSNEEMEDYIFTEAITTDKDGQSIKYKKLATRSLADLTTALEKCHALTYLALNDTVQDRTRRKEQVGGDDGAAMGDMHSKIAEAMASVGASNTPRAQLLDMQIQQAELIKEEARKQAIEHPSNNDDH